MANFTVDDDVGFWGFVGRSKWDTIVQWRCDASMSSNSNGKRGRCWPFVENGRWVGRVATRCGNTGSGGEGSRILDGYLVRELLPPLILGTVAFTVLGVSIGE